jgi:hypothetical protein
MKNDQEEKRRVFIIRIFRWGTGTDDTLLGTIEDVRGVRKGVFKTGKELLNWLFSHKNNEKGRRYS